MGNSKKQSDPEDVLAELRALVREAHAFMHDYAQARKETAAQIKELRTLIHDVTDEKMESAANARIREMHAQINKNMEDDVDKIHKEFMELRDLIMGRSRKAKNSETLLTLKEAVELVAGGMPVTESKKRLTIDTEVLK